MCTCTQQVDQDPDHYLTLHGNPHLRRYCFSIDDYTLKVPLSSFELLVRLAAGRIATDSGCVCLYTHIADRNVHHQIVHRLRRALNTQFRPLAGDELIRFAGCGEYFLTIPPHNITVCESLFDLVPNHLPEGVLTPLAQMHRNVRDAKATAKKAENIISQQPFFATPSDFVVPPFAACGGSPQEMKERLT